mmetsp:Transcript_29928/g.69917  ORF Transcript_29928/g.69917 Transcript_29928/m.69917 type:complete len:392 (+) Transcript_29928:273-1448(+)
MRGIVASYRRKTQKTRTSRAEEKKHGASTVKKGQEYHNVAFQTCVHPLTGGIRPRGPPSLRVVYCVPRIAESSLIRFSIPVSIPCTWSLTTTACSPRIVWPALFAASCRLVMDSDRVIRSCLVSSRALRVSSSCRTLLSITVCASLSAWPSRLISSMTLLLFSLMASTSAIFLCASSSSDSRSEMRACHCLTWSIDTSWNPGGADPDTASAAGGGAAAEAPDGEAAAAAGEAWAVAEAPVGALASRKYVHTRCSLLYSPSSTKVTMSGESAPADPLSFWITRSAIASSQRMAPFALFTMYLYRRHSPICDTFMFASPDQCGYSPLPVFSITAFFASHMPTASAEPHTPRHSPGSVLHFTLKDTRVVSSPVLATLRATVLFAASLRASSAAF